MPLWRPSIEPMKRAASRDEPLASRSPLQGGGMVSSPRSVGPNREPTLGLSVSRRLSSLAMAAPPNAVPATSVSAAAMAAPARSRCAPARGAHHASRLAEAREEARADQREQPRVGRLERWHQGLRAERLELVEDEPDRRQQHEQRRHREGDDQRMGGLAAGERRPDDARHGDAERQQHRDADDDVERSAGPVREQDQGSRQRPRAHEREAEQPQPETSNPHGAESNDGPPRGLRRRRAAISTVAEEVPLGVGPAGHRDPTFPGPACPHHRGPTAADTNGRGGLWVMDGRAQRGSRGRGRSPRARFVGAIGGGGVHGRTWLRGHDPEALRDARPRRRTRRRSW